MTSPNLDQLRSELRTLADQIPDNVDRDHEVAGRIRRRQHRRRAAAGAAVGALVLVLVAGFGLLPRLTGDQTLPPTHPSPSATDQPLPEYLRGGKLIASKQGTDARGITLTFTPTSLDFGFVVACDNPSLAKERQPPHNDFAELKLNGHNTIGTSCGYSLGLGGDANFGRDGVDAGAKYGVSVGEPVTVQLAFGNGGVHPGTQWRIGVYQRVPLTDYPFPAAPAHLVPLRQAPTMGPHLHNKKVFSQPAHPSNPNGWSYTIPLNHGLTWRTVAVAPTSLTLLVNGKPVTTSYAWDYSIQQSEASFTLAQLGVQPGQKVTIRVDQTNLVSGGFVPDSAAFVIWDDPGSAGR
jgi:hypothetical protein